MVTKLGQLSEDVSAIGLPTPAVHAQKRLGAALPSEAAVAELEETARFARKIGARVLVMHLWDLPDSDARFDERLAAARIASDIAESHEIELAIETIPCTHSTPLRNVRRVLEHDPRVRVALDTEFLAMHGEVADAMEADWLWPSVRHVHLKDFADGLLGADGRRRYLSFGDGSIDFAAFFQTLEDRCFTGAVSLEAPSYREDGTQDAEALRRHLGRLSSNPWRFD
jgi:sugar phosphate isomerase/epimerase